MENDMKPYVVKKRREGERWKVSSAHATMEEALAVCASHEATKNQKKEFGVRIAVWKGGRRRSEAHKLLYASDVAALTGLPVHVCSGYYDGAAARIRKRASKA